MPDMHLVEIRDEAAADHPQSGPEILLAGWPAAAADLIIAGLQRRGIRAHGVARATLTGRAVLALGPELTPDAAKELLSDTPDTWLVLSLGGGAPADHLYFSSTHPPAAEDTVELLHAAWKEAARPPSEPAEDDGQVLDLLRRLTRETELWPAVRAIAREARTGTDATHSCLWIFDTRDASLVTEERRQRAGGGLTSYVARTGRGVAVERLEDDPRYDTDLDGDAGDRFVASPIAFDDRVLGVLALRRPPNAPPFTDAEQQRLAWMNRLVAPTLARLVLDWQLEQRAAERHAAIRGDVAQLYREEALEQYQRGRTDEAHLLEIEPGWTRHAFRILLALLVAALVFGALVHVDRQADGVGIVREGRLIAVVPARDRAQLRAGLPLRFEHAAEPLAVTSVDRRIIPAADARRLLGVDGARLWTTTQPGVRIEGSLSTNDLTDGVTGRVRVRLGRQRLLLLWVRRG